MIASDHQYDAKVKVPSEYVKHHVKEEEQDWFPQVRKAMGSKVAVEIKVDPTLLGGLVVKVGSRMVDASLRSKLHRLQLAMKGV